MRETSWVLHYNSTHVEQEEIMENTIIAREHSFTNKGLKTATNRIIKATRTDLSFMYTEVFNYGT